jgi:hypothetical protein
MPVAPSSAPASQSALATSALPIAAAPSTATVTPAATHVPTTTPAGAAAPVSAGAFADVGVLVVRDPQGTLYRYDGARGGVERLTRLSAWTLVRETDRGAYWVGTHGGVEFIPWHGDPRDVDCGQGQYVAVSAADACASSSYWTGAFARYPSEAAARLIVPPDWQPNSVEWQPDSRGLAMTRFSTDRIGHQLRGQNTLWLLQPDGQIQRVFAPCCGAVWRVRWSSSARTIAASLTTGCAGCDEREGYDVVLLDAQAGATFDLARTEDGIVRWSRHDALAFVHGTRAQADHAVLSVRYPDGRVRELDLGGFAPVWDDTGERLAWVRSDGTARLLEVGSGDTQTRWCAEPGMLVEGVRFARTGDGLLLLCHGDTPRRLEIVYSTSERSVLVLSGLGWPPMTSTNGPIGAIAWSEGADTH